MKNNVKKFLGVITVFAAVIGFISCSSEGDESHKHTFATEWSSDATTHWHVATCEHKDQFKDKSAHAWNHDEYQYDIDFGNDIRTCTVCSYIESILHVHVEEDETVEKAASCVTKGVMTYRCLVCQKIFSKEIPELFSSPIDVETGKTATSLSKYIYFGVFPQSVLSPSEKVTVDEEVSVKMGANIYYKGSDGEWYIKSNASPFSKSYYFYTDDVQPVVKDENYYFLVKPILWKVITNNYNGTGKSLLVAEDLLISNIPYYLDKTERVINGKTIYPSNYRYSTIRAYLNGRYESDDIQEKKYENIGFLQTVFTAEGQALICDTTVDNSGDSTTDATGRTKKADGTAIKSGAEYYPDYTCENTEDKIFLLSFKEMTTIEYGFEDIDVMYADSRVRKATDYALANNIFIQGKWDEGYGGYWWIRTPYFKDDYKAHAVEGIGASWNLESVDSLYYGIVPALCLSLE